MNILRGTSDPAGATERRVAGCGGPVLLLSMRRVADLVAYCLQYEFEDVVAEITGADRVDVEAEGALEFSRRAYKLARMMGPQSLARRIAPKPATVRLERSYELFFPTFNHIHELYALATVPDWKQHCRVSACYINEVWETRLPEPYLLELLQQFDHIFLGTHGCVAEVQRRVGRPCSYLPLATDVVRFSPFPNPPQRSIDICNIGRRSADTHEAFIRMAQARKIAYYYDTFSAPSNSRQRTFRVANPSEHRLLLGALLQRSRYYIANRARVNEPEHTGACEEVSGRFYEGAAAGAVLLGVAPNTDSFREQFDWEDAVIPLPFHCPDVESVLAPYESDPERLSLISRRNAHHAALKHDWLHRLQHVFKIFNIKQTPGMLEREQRLARIAELALPGTSAAQAA